MSCSHPLLAVNYGKDPSGKMKVKILTRIDEVQSVEQATERYAKFGDQLMLLSCGKCPGCLRRRRAEWAVRCEMESKYHCDNCFVTLTYDDSNLPSKPIKKHYRDFIKSLRNNGFSLRYFGCCERGSKTGRLHYHIILFGYIPSDLKKSHKSDAGFWCYQSKFLSDIWKKGLVVVNEFSPACAAYVAGYVDKKLNGQSDDSFIFMSTKPGIGKEYLEDRMEHLLKYDNVISFNGHVSSLPRYLTKLADRKGVNLDYLRNSRVEASRVSRLNDMRYKDCKTYNDYFARVLDDEIDALMHRKRGL